ncbi:MAG: alpha/beta hydrolase [Lachnospiraceae bacterium]|nr:alpha/beta hydrolase [Lachnospiraceae bacterium]
MSTPAIIALIVVIVLVLAMCAVFFFFASYVTLPVNSLERSINWEKDHNFYRDFDERKVEEYRLTSFDGYILHAYFVPNKDFPDSRKFIIISHGYTSSHYGALKYLNKWMELGFQCVLYDDRYHGQNQKSRKGCSTLGVREAKDLMTVINDTYERYGKDIYLGLQGESMGSGLEITALKYKPQVHFIVNDCGFADLFNVLEGALNAQFHLHKWLIWPSSWMCRLVYGWSFFESRPIDSLKDNTVPICFIHGEADTFINPVNSIRMAKANPAYSEVHIFPKAAHAETMMVDEDRYLRILKKFLAKVEDIEAGRAKNVSDDDFEGGTEKYLKD